MEEAHYKLLRLIDSKPPLTQRELARELGVSLGKVNYCVNALIEKGWVKARNFRKSNNKLAYAYLLTPRGVEKKATIAFHFLQRKVAEYESLKKEIAVLRREIAGGHQALSAGGGNELGRLDSDAEGRLR
jgi:MarR family transcriptional regulator, temperature-dependent positive regulator of motility